MDDRSFDALTRALGGASSRRSALAALAGIAAGAGLAGREADAKKKRRKRCDPACAAGQTCTKGACACDNGGAVCGANCCTGGQTCQSGTCADPLPQCLAFGAACKGTGVPCCDGTVCASGQAGKGDIACYTPAGVPCETTADCVFDATCKDGLCVASPQPQPEPGCVPAFTPTGDAAANGLKLQEAWEAAKTGGPTVISLAPGTYAMDPADPNNPVGFSWDRGEVTLQGCPGGSVLLTFARSSGFEVTGGSARLSNLTLNGTSGVSSGYGVLTSQSGAVTLDQCTVTAFIVAGVYASGAGATVTVTGGVYTPNGTVGDPATDVAYWNVNSASLSSFICSGSPQAVRCQGFQDPGLISSCGCTGS